MLLWTYLAWPAIATLHTSGLTAGVSAKTVPTVTLAAQALRAAMRWYSLPMSLGSETFGLWQMVARVGADKMEAMASWAPLVRAAVEAVVVEEMLQSKVNRGRPEAMGATQATVAREGSQALP